MVLGINHAKLAAFKAIEFFTVFHKPLLKIDTGPKPEVPVSKATNHEVMMTGTDDNPRPEHAYATDGKNDGRSAKRRKLDTRA